MIKINDVKKIKLFQIVDSSDIDLSKYKNGNSIISNGFSINSKKSIYGEFDIFIESILEDVEEETLTINTNSSDMDIKNKIISTITDFTMGVLHGDNYIISSYNLLCFLNNTKEQYTDYYNNKLGINFIINNNIGDKIIIGNSDTVKILYNNVDHNANMFFLKDDINLFRKITINNIEEIDNVDTNIDTQFDIDDISDNDTYLDNDVNIDETTNNTTDNDIDDIDPFDEDYVEISQDYISDNIFVIKLKYDNITDYIKRQFTENISKIVYYKQPSKIITNPLLFDIMKNETLFEENNENYFSTNNESNIIKVGKLVNVDLYLNKLLRNNQIVLENNNGDPIFKIEVDVI